MGADLIATTVPKLTEREYEDAITNASANTLATAAFKASYQEDFGDDVAFAERAAELISNVDPAIIDQLTKHTGALEAIRAAARNGAQYVLKRMPYGGAFVYDASLVGGPDVLVVGGSSFGDDPFDEFRHVALLAAILTTQTARH